MKTKKNLMQVSNCKFDNSVQFGKYFYAGINHSNDSDYVLLYEGFVINKDFKIDEIIPNFKSNGLKYLNSLLGNYNIIIIDKIENKVYVSNDQFAIRGILRYFDGTNFVISNKFWNMLDIIQPSFEQLDIDQICAYALYGKYLYKKTLIKNLEMQLAGSNIIYDGNTNTMEENLYYDYHSDFVPEDISLDKAADRFQEALLEFQAFVNKNYAGEKIGLSISGGLDSRILPALFGKDKEYFVIAGEDKKSKYGLEPYNLNYIKKIGKAYGVDIKIVNAAATPTKEKVDIELQNFPLGNNNIPKTVDMSRSGLDFDVLLTAGAPDMLTEIRTYVSEGGDFFDIIEHGDGNRYLLKHGVKSNYLKKLKTMLFERKNTFSIYSALTYIDFYPVKIMDKDTFYERIHSYLTSCLKIGQDSLFLLNYRINSNALDQFCGAFESLTGQCDALSMFHPFVNEVLKKTPDKYICNRLVLKKVIEKYYPEVYNIESEHSIEGIHNEEKASILSIIKALIRFKFGGMSSIGINENQKREYISLYDQECSWFDKIFDGEKIRAISNDNPNPFLTYLKLKLVMGTIERKEWSKYC